MNKNISKKTNKKTFYVPSLNVPPYFGETRTCDREWTIVDVRCPEYMDFSSGLGTAVGCDIFN